MNFECVKNLLIEEYILLMFYYDGESLEWFYFVSTFEGEYMRKILKRFFIT